MAVFTYGRYLSASRRSLRLSQEKFAEKIEVESRTVQRWESDENVPRKSTIYQMQLLNLRSFEEIRSVVYQCEFQQFVSEMIRSKFTSDKKLLY
jgi:transcriptional regulator with XRE-family HTH domain